MSVYITRKQVADFFKVAQSTIVNWDKRKILNPIKIGGNVYYKKDEVTAMLPGKEVSDE